MKLLGVSLCVVSLIAIAPIALGQEKSTQAAASVNLTEPYAVCNPMSQETTACLYPCNYRRRPMDAPCLMPPKPTYTPEAEYTDKARRQRISGRVMLKMTVDKTGKVTAVDVVQGLEPSLDKESKKTAQSWKFQPAMLDGKAVAVVLPVEMTFNVR